MLTSANERGGVPKTKLMYEAFLSFAQLKDYLALLLENGMLEYDPQTKKYVTTQKGKQMIRSYQKINDMVGK